MFNSATNPKPLEIIIASVQYYNIMVLGGKITSTLVNLD